MRSVKFVVYGKERATVMGRKNEQVTIPVANKIHHDLMHEHGCHQVEIVKDRLLGDIYYIPD